MWSPHRKAREYGYDEQVAKFLIDSTGMEPDELQEAMVDADIAAADAIHEALMNMVMKDDDDDGERDCSWCVRRFAQKGGCEAMLEREEFIAMNDSRRPTRRVAHPARLRPLRRRGA